MTQNIIEEVKKIVKAKLDKEESGHDWFHTLRVFNNACKIANTENCDLLTVQLGALFHDIADHKFGYSDEDRKIIIENLLINLDVPSDIIENVIYIANSISFKNGKNPIILKNIESKIVQDADRLEAIGAIGIARTFTYGGFKGRAIYNPDSSIDNNDSISHFYEKLLKLKETMNTETGKNLANERHKFMELFLEEFYKEWNY